MSEGDEEGSSWLTWFHEQPVHAWMCRVDQSFIEDNFNLYGLPEEIVSAGSSLSSVREGVDIILGDVFGAQNISKRLARVHPRLHLACCCSNARQLAVAASPTLSLLSLSLSCAQTATWTITWPRQPLWMRARCTDLFTRGLS